MKESIAGVRNKIKIKHSDGKSECLKRSQRMNNSHVMIDHSLKKRKSCLTFFYSGICKDRVKMLKRKYSDGQSEYLESYHVPVICLHDSTFIKLCKYEMCYV